jgi:RNA polymerase sigma-70 factor (ECF subfamily)
MTETSQPISHGAFHTTQWTRVLASRGDSPESQAALGDLCGAYYGAVFDFICRSGRDEETARELTQEFFARLLARQGLDTVEQGRGRFRSFLLGAVKHFLADMSDRARAAKRGSGTAPLPLGVETDTSPGLEVPDATAPDPEREFDRKWALTVLDRALAALAREQADAGHATHFATLKPWLTGDTGTVSQADAARALEMNEGAVKVAVHRLRRRFRELVKAEIAQTLQDPAQVKDELACLQAALAGK